MKSFLLFAVVGFLFSIENADAKPLKTKVRDVKGTTFIVTADFETKSVRVSLKANPAGLTGIDFERQLQLAVYYGSSISCRMLKSGRSRVGKSEVQGILWCKGLDDPRPGEGPDPLEPNDTNFFKGAIS